MFDGRLAGALKLALAVVLAAPGFYAAASQPIDRERAPDLQNPPPSRPAQIDSPDDARIRQAIARRIAAVARMRAGIAPGDYAVRISAVLPGSQAQVTHFQGLRQEVDAAALADSVPEELAAQGSTINLHAPAITRVNGKASGAQLTPGAHLTIRGFRFEPTGAAPTARLMSAGFPGGGVDLSIQSATDGVIVAVLPATLTSVLDDAAAVVEVSTVQGLTLRSAPVDFIATRETVGWIAFTNTTQVGLRAVFDSAWKPPGIVPYRYAEGESIDCPAQGGGDAIKSENFKPGFFVSSASMIGGPTDSGDGDGYGDAGSRMVFGAYGLQITANTVYASWAVWRSHRSPISVAPGVNLQNPQDICLSSYTLELYVTGPAGLRAW